MADRIQKHKVIAKLSKFTLQNELDTVDNHHVHRCGQRANTQGNRVKS